jgi:nucleotide-binding universal stress UspA family protein
MGDGSMGSETKLSIKRILVPVDFSETSEHAVDHAIEVARTFGAKIELFHSYPSAPGSITPYGPVLPEGIFQAYRDSAEARISEVRNRVKDAGVEVGAHLSSDVPSMGIVEAAKTLDVDLIVIGTRGLSGLKHVLLGSVAERTVRAAECSVLTVGPVDQASS